MDISIGTLELNRSNPAHVGTKAILDTSKSLHMDSFGNVSNDGPEAEKTRGTFESYLMEAVSSMNNQQLNVSALQEKVITDPDSVDIHDVTIAMSKAQMSLTLAQTVIDRVVSGWNELSQNR